MKTQFIHPQEIDNKNLSYFLRDYDLALMWKKRSTKNLDRYAIEGSSTNGTERNYREFFLERFFDLPIDELWNALPKQKKPRTKSRIKGTFDSLILKGKSVFVAYDEMKIDVSHLVYVCMVPKQHL